MLATPLFTGAILDATGTPNGSILLALVIFANVVPLALTFTHFKTRGKDMHQKEQTA